MECVWVLRSDGRRAWRSFTILADGYTSLLMQLPRSWRWYVNDESRSRSSGADFLFLPLVVKDKHSAPNLPYNRYTLHRRTFVQHHRSYDGITSLLLLKRTRGRKIPKYCRLACVRPFRQETSTATTTALGLVTS